MTGKRNPGETGFPREKIKKGLLIIALIFVPGLVRGETLSMAPNSEQLTLDQAILEKISLPVKQEK